MKIEWDERVTYREHKKHSLKVTKLVQFSKGIEARRGLRSCVFNGR